ncbi:MAG: hypothetical protein IKM36_00610, partial [Oscillospiraceae bacterium]|nr:hypothetical protein [Oscillospiraceae bacterium]
GGVVPQRSAISPKTDAKGKSYRTIPQSRLRRASSLYAREPPATLWEHKRKLGLKKQKDRPESLRFRGGFVLF